MQLEEKVKEMHHKREDLYLKREMAPANVTVSVMNATLHQIDTFHRTPCCSACAKGYEKLLRNCRKSQRKENCEHQL